MVRCALFGTCFDALIERILFFTHLFEHDFIFNILPDRQGNAGQRRFAWNTCNDLAQCQKSKRFRWNVLNILYGNRPAACPALVSFFFPLTDSFANAAILWPMSSFPATVQYSDWRRLPAVWRSSRHIGFKPDFHIKQVFPLFWHAVLSMWSHAIFTTTLKIKPGLIELCSFLEGILKWLLTC